MLALYCFYLASLESLIFVPSLAFFVRVCLSWLYAPCTSELRVTIKQGGRGELPLLPPNPSLLSHVRLSHR